MSQRISMNNNEVSTKLMVCGEGRGELMSNLPKHPTNKSRNLCLSFLQFPQTTLGLFFEKKKHNCWLDMYFWTCSVIKDLSEEILNLLNLLFFSRWDLITVFCLKHTFLHIYMAHISILTSYLMYLSTWNSIPVNCGWCYLTALIHLFAVLYFADVWWGQDLDGKKKENVSSMPRKSLYTQSCWQFSLQEK